MLEASHQIDMAPSRLTAVATIASAKAVSTSLRSSNVRAIHASVGGMTSTNGSMRRASRPPAVLPETVRM